MGDLAVAATGRVERGGQTRALKTLSWYTKTKSPALNFRNSTMLL